MEFLFCALMAFFKFLYFYLAGAGYLIRNYGFGYGVEGI